MIRTFDNSPWDELLLWQKKVRINKFTCIPKLRFWYVCGKIRQKHYQHLTITESNVDTIRDHLFEEYAQGLEKSDVFDKDLKLAKAKKLLF